MTLSPHAAPERSAEQEQAARRQELLAAGLLIGTGLDGLYGLSGEFESVVNGLSTVLADLGADQVATIVRFPPVITNAVLEKSGYVRSFPDLIGTVRTFGGGDREHARLLASLDAGQDWADGLQPADVSLCAAACHPLYPTLPETIPSGGLRTNVFGWVFRHEPSLDPARMQAFRQYEYVYVGDAAGALAHRDLWRERAATLMTELDLEVTVEVANDPFFGRMGRILADSQQLAALKYEILAPTNGSGRLTAVCSANCHEAHFGEAFGLRASDGSVAHSACVGFGVERITLALLWRHGLRIGAWPQHVRARLGL